MRNCPILLDIRVFKNFGLRPLRPAPLLLPALPLTLMIFLLCCTTAIKSTLTNRLLYKYITTVKNKAGAASQDTADRQQRRQLQQTWLHYAQRFPTTAERNAQNCTTLYILIILTLEHTTIQPSTSAGSLLDSFRARTSKLSSVFFTLEKPVLRTRMPLS